MSTVQKVEPLSIKDYLALENRGEERHEYVNGSIYAMVGGTARHNQITSAISSALRTHLKGKSCTVFMSDMKVQAESVFYYPDVMVVCSPVDLDSLFQSEPVLLVEVLSKSTEAKDRLEKLVAYQSILTVNEYVLVSQDKVSIDIYRRGEDGWQLISLSYGDTVSLVSVDYEADIETFYEDVIESF
ncbi:MAG: Uma2 family endonuclease [Gammaproteobacteria bacterium]